MENPSYRDPFTTEITQAERRGGERKLKGGKLFRGFMWVIGASNTRRELAEVEAMRNIDAANRRHDAAPKQGNAGRNYDPYVHPGVPAVLTPESLQVYHGRAKEYRQLHDLPEPEAPKPAMINHEGVIRSPHAHQQTSPNKQPRVRHGQLIGVSHSH